MAVRVRRKRFLVAIEEDGGLCLQVVWHAGSHAYLKPLDESCEGDIKREQGTGKYRLKIDRIPAGRSVTFLFFTTVGPKGQSYMNFLGGEYVHNGMPRLWGDAFFSYNSAGHILTKRTFIGVDFDWINRRINAHRTERPGTMLSVIHGW